MRSRLPHLGGALVICLLAALGLGACKGGEGDGLAAIAPPDSPLFVEVGIDPEGEQAEAFTSFVERVAGIRDVRAEVIAALDRELAADGTDITFEEDIEPWLGDRAGVFVRSFEPSEVAGGVPDFAAAVEVSDADAAQSFLDQAAASVETLPETRSYGGHDYRYAPADGGVAVGLIDDKLVVGTESSFMVAVDAAEGESLVDSEEYRGMTDALSDERLVTAFVNPGAALDAAIREEGEIDRSEERLLRPLLGGPLANSAAAGIVAAEDSVSLETTAFGSAEDAGPGSLLIESLPAESWLAVAAPELGTMLAGVLDQVEHRGLPGAGAIRRRLRRQIGIDLRGDLVRWLGGAALFVEGTGFPGVTAGLIAETSDVDGPRRLLHRVEAIAERDSGLRSSGPPEGAGYGFSLGVPSLGGGVEAGVVGDRLVAVAGGTLAQALAPERTLAEDERFEAAVEALGEGFDPNAYLYLPSLLELAERGGAAEDPDFAAALPHLERFEAAVSGMRTEGEEAVTRWTLTLDAE